ncbi:MAG: ABC transporter substrate-binding protein [Deltaproteobacteria bacterium]|nr:ABC transporter substrate-binding protein [Deltaproteobacteria bacterium]
MLLFSLTEEIAILARRNILVALGVLSLLANCQPKEPKEQVIRVAVMPNLTHAPAFVGLAEGLLAQELGASIQIKPQLFNAGPSIVEAVLAGEIDLAYLGPGPALNGYFRSKGKGFKALAGVTSGGAALVVRQGVSIVTSLDLHGKRLATPQIGNTQDIALRYWLSEVGLQTKEQGGTVSVIPVENPMQLPLLLRGEIDGVWTIEPWVSQLILKGSGKILFEEASLWPQGHYLTVLLIASQPFLEKHPQWVEQWMAGHVQTIRWIRSHSEEARDLTRSEIKRLAQLDMDPPVFSAGWSRLEFTFDPLKDSFREMARRSAQIGYLKGSIEGVDDIWDLRFLDKTLKQIP